MIRDDLARRLKYYRERSGMTIYEVGERIGKSGKTISAWKNGKGQPDADMLMLLCDLYDIASIAELFGQKIPYPDPIQEDSGMAELQEIYTALNANGKEELLKHGRLLVKSGEYTDFPALKHA